MVDHLLFQAANYLFQTIRYGSAVVRCLTPLVLESGTFTGNMLPFQTAPKAISLAGYVTVDAFIIDGIPTDLLILRFWFGFQNYKRVAEVWMDEYKEYLYKRRPQYRNLEVGDLSSQTEIRERLHCKVDDSHVLRVCNETQRCNEFRLKFQSFKWFMTNIAFDLPKKYPPIEPPDFASGEVFITFKGKLLLSRNSSSFIGSRFEAKPIPLCVWTLNSKRKTSALI